MSELDTYFDLLRKGDAEGLKRLFSGDPVIDDPRFGHVESCAVFGAFVKEYSAWLGKADVPVVAVTDTEERLVVEFELQHEDAKAPLPLALAADRAGGAFSAIRVYFSMWPLLDRHVFREPLLEEDPLMVIPDSIGHYHDALMRGDLDDIMDVFEDDGYAREPAGGEWVYQGKDRLREFYGMLFSGGGGIVLEHCTFTDDCVRGALEYNAMAWGETSLEGQSSIAVHEWGKSGLLHAARIYDDVDPPV